MPTLILTPPDSQQFSRKRRIGQILSEMVQGVGRSKYIAYRLVVKDVRVEHSHSRLGFFWDFADPFVLGFIFYVLMNIGIVRPGIPSIPLPVFLIYGVLLYETFSESLLLSLNSIRRSKSILTHLKVPPEAIILSTVFRVLFNSTFRISIMLAFSVALHVVKDNSSTSSLSPGGFVMFLLLYPTIILMGVSLGTLLAPFNVVYSDVGRLVKLALVPLRYATPVFYTIPQKSDSAVLQFFLSMVNNYNPLTYVLVNLRSLATSGTISYPLETMVVLIMSAILFMVAWFIFHLTLPVLGDKA